MANTRSLIWDNIFQSEIPSRIIFGLVKHSAFNGSYASDPFLFQPYGLSSVTLSVNGETINSKPLLCDFTNKQYLKAYMSFFDGLGMQFRNTGNTITYQEYGSSDCFFCYDLTPDSSANDPSHISLVNSGVVRLELQFSADLANNITVVMLGEREALLEISEKRDVISTD